MTYAAVALVLPARVPADEGVLTGCRADGQQAGLDPVFVGPREVRPASIFDRPGRLDSARGQSRAVGTAT